MASVDYGDSIFGLADLKVTNIGGTTQEDFGGGQTLEFEEEMIGGVLTGDDRKLASVAITIGAKAKVTAGKMQSAALAIMTGRALATSGTSPNEVTTMTFSAGDAMPYFKLYGKAIDDGAGDAQIQIFKCKLMSGLKATFQYGEFFVHEFEVECFDDGTNGIADWVQHETAAALPTS